MHEDLAGLDLDLEKADLETMREIVRQAERFLDSQLQAGIAADQRAATFSSITAAVIAVLIGGLLTTLSEPTFPSEVGYVFSVVLVGLLISLGLSLSACRPTEWRFAGSNPRHWRREVNDDVALSECLAGQAHLYAKGIVHNRDILIANADTIAWALWVAGHTLFVGAVGTMVLFVVL